MQSTWDALVEEINGEVFLTFDWLRIWWTHYHRGRSLILLVFERQNTLIGLIPFSLEELGWGPWRLKILRTLGTDYTPVSVSLMVRPADVNDLADAFIVRFVQTMDSHLMVLGPSAGKCPSFVPFMKRLQARYPDRTSICSAGEQTYFNLAPDWENQIAGMSYRERNRMRAIPRKLSAAGYSLRSEVSSETDVEAHMVAFMEAHQQKWMALGQGGHFHDWPDATAFHHDVARAQYARGRLRLLRIMLNEQTVGFKYCFKTGHMYCSYLEARGEDVPGIDLDMYRLNFQELARLGIAEGVRFIDSMRGRYAHKLHLGGYMKPNYRLLWRKEGVRMRMLIAWWRYRARLERLLYLSLWRRRIRPRLGFSPRPFRESWIRFAAFADGG